MFAGGAKEGGGVGGVLNILETCRVYLRDIFFDCFTCYHTELAIVDQTSFFIQCGRISDYFQLSPFGSCE